MNRVCTLTLGLSLVCGHLCAASLPYGVSFLSNNIITSSCPSSTGSVVSGQCESGSVLLVPEQQDKVLNKAVKIDIGANLGLYNDPAQLLTTNNLIAPGTEVNSYFFHFDAVGTPAKSVTPGNAKPSLGAGVAEVRFNTPILGIQVLAATLNNKKNNSSQVQLTGLTYDTDDAPGLELATTNTGDWIQVIDSHTLEFKLNVSGTNVDDLRVLVAAPEPVSITFIGLGLLGIGLLRRKRT